MTAVHLLIPVKHLNHAKSRLDLPPGRRRAVARVLFERTMGTAVDCLGASSVSIVTADDGVRRIAARVGVRSVDDLCGSLNGAIRAAISNASAEQRAGVHAVLVSDLPALQSGDLREVLRIVTESEIPRHVPDHLGTGTTFASFPPGSRARVAFGSNSARQFVRLGSRPIRNAPTGIRTDLDTLQDLELLEDLSMRLDDVIASHVATRANQIP